MSNRLRKKYLAYQSYTSRAKNQPCQFCAFKKGDEQVVRSTKYFWVVRNIFSFDLWDTAKVNDHLMLVPKRHVDSIGHFNEEEQVAYAKLCGEYDLKGYSIYARPKGSTHKTVSHQHAHLISLDRRKKKMIFYLKRPYLLWFK